MARLAWVAVLSLGLYVFFASLQVGALSSPNPGSDQPQLEIARLAPEDEAALRQLGLSTGFYDTYVFAFEIAWLMLFCVPAGLIFWRKSDERIGLFVSFMLLIVGLFFPFRLTAPAEDPAAWHLLATFFSALGAGLLVFFGYVVPDGRFVPGWTRWPAIICSALLIVILSLAGRTEAMTNPAFYGSLLALSAVNSPIAALAQVYRYRHVSTPLERQQTKWILLGLVASALGGVVLILLMSDLPGLAPAGTARRVMVLARVPVGVLTLSLIPVTISLSILRYRLWDIDLIIRRTLVYGLLTGTLALVYWASVVLLQSLFRLLTRQEPSQIVTVLSTLAIAAVAAPLRRSIQAGIDRRFYRRKYDAARTLAAFGTTAREEVDLDGLTARLLTVVQDTMEPAHVSLGLTKTAREKTKVLP